jgi:hypothetical protein
MEHHWGIGRSVLVRHALAPKVAVAVAVAGDPLAEVVGLMVEVVGLVVEVVGADTKILASYELRPL